MNQAQAAVVLFAGVLAVSATVLFALETAIVPAWIMMVSALLGYLTILAMIAGDRADGIDDR